MSNDSLWRDNVVVEGEEMRLYGPAGEQPRWPSVSTVLDSAEDGDKEESLSGWKQWLRRQPDRPDPEDVLRYKGARGTLAHWDALKSLADGELLGDEEMDAYESLDGWQYEFEDALSKAEHEVAWFTEQFDAMADDWGITPQSIRAVEQYVVDREVGYAGQYDLAWQLDDGTTYIGDLKTSKADSVTDLKNKKFPRYPLQLAAYARAANFEVDGAVIFWASPDTHGSAAIPDSEWDQSLDAYEREFIDYTEELRQTTLADWQPDGGGYGNGTQARHG